MSVFTFCFRFPLCFTTVMSRKRTSSARKAPTRYDMYKLPLESIDVEILAQKLFKYYIFTAEDSHVINADGDARRDEAIAKLYGKIKTTPVLSPYALVPFGEDPTDYLNHIDAAIEEIPTTFEK